jgi:hypothetical protein
MHELNKLNKRMTIHMCISKDFIYSVKNVNMNKDTIMDNLCGAKLCLKLELIKLHYFICNCSRGYVMEASIKPSTQNIYLNI